MNSRNTPQALAVLAELLKVANELVATDRPRLPLVAVGSGALSDTCKYATFKDGRKYATFGTAASMNGYAASTASVTLANGYKTSLPAHAPRGIFPLGNGGEAAVLFCFIFLYFALSGAGAWSVDSARNATA